VEPDDDDDGVGALGPRRPAEPLAQLDGGHHLPAQVDQPGDGRGGQRHPGQALHAWEIACGAVKRGQCRPHAERAGGHAVLYLTKRLGGFWRVLGSSEK